MIQMSQRMMMQQKQSPQQVLLSTLLQLPVLRLEQRIKQELEMNPLLELDMELEEMQQQEMEEAQKEEEEEEEEKPEEETEVDWEEILNDENNMEIKQPRDKNEEEINRPEAAPITLMDHLLEQLHLAPFDEKQMLIGEYVLWCIDDDGYLGCEIDAIAEYFDTIEEEVEKVIQLIQRFDPVGIGARNLQECLLIQLYELHPDEDMSVRMLLECFEDFANKRFEKIAKKLEIDLPEVKRIMDLVAKLNPKPGERYVSEAENYIIPDAVIVREDDEYRIQLNDWNIPRLRINESYKQMLKQKQKVSKETKDYIRQRLESARWLINSIYQRRATILRVMESIVKNQKDFFDIGPEMLKPMILKDVADDVSLDISTVSRVTSGKYVQTEYGVFELKYFFSERLETADGEEVSNKLIKEKIRQIIEKEDSKKPFNDQTISEMLKVDGFLLARRTVAKYREQMMIPVARLRRKI